MAVFGKPVARERCIISCTKSVIFSGVYFAEMALRYEIFECSDHQVCTQYACHFSRNFFCYKIKQTDTGTEFYRYKVTVTQIACFHILLKLNTVMDR